MKRKEHVTSQWQFDSRPLAVKEDLGNSGDNNKLKQLHASEKRHSKKSPDEAKRSLTSKVNELTVNR